MDQENKISGFRAEADMLVPLVEQAESLIQPLSGRLQILFEVQSAAGVPDLVLAVFDSQELARRERYGLPAVTDAPDVAVMTVLGALAARSSEATLTPTQLSRFTGVTSSHLSSAVLKRLADNGHIKRVKRGHWAATHPFKPLAHQIVSIETKLNDWRRGFWQAHRQAADYTWLVMDEMHSFGLSSKREYFLSNKVGLATLSAVSGYLDVIVPALCRKPLSMHRNLLIERAADLYLSGKVSGPLTPVFGRQLLSTRGADPRLISVAVH
ncbi:hypothetical protein ACFYSC_36335 [Streptosporangium sp. NPDC004379]|uniref:hypothetical protein n=1 Tax=Streptosporangium sp. NPDC004379 TaxID=3366189 RepID=UPI0036A190B8